MQALTNSKRRGLRWVFPLRLDFLQHEGTPAWSFEGKHAIRDHLSVHIPPAGLGQYFFGKAVEARNRQLASIDSSEGSLMLEAVCVRYAGLHAAGKDTERVTILAGVS